MKNNNTVDEVLCYSNKLNQFNTLQMTPNLATIMSVQGFWCCYVSL